MSSVPGEAALADAPGWVLEVASTGGVVNGVKAQLSEPDPSRLSRSTALFLQFGAPEGERNRRLYAAACDMAGCGFPESEAEGMLTTAAARCGLGAEETAKSIRSAYSAPRSPARPDRETGIPEHLRMGGGLGPPPRAGGSEADPAPGKVGTVRPSTPANRALLSNVVDSWRENAEGKRVPIQVYRPLDEVSGELLRLSDGWPKMAGGALFVDRGGLIGERGRVRTLGKTESLFAWMQERHAVRWSKSQCQDAETGSPRNPPTKSEFFDHFKDTAADRYLAASAYPHVPPMHSVYYLPCELPAPTGERLTEFMAAMNPQTEQDRDLMLAALLTMLWGGEPGTRPAFVFCSKHGRGSGKTSTAVALAEVLGGAPLLDYKDNWTEVCKRIMSSEDRESRCFIFDNIRGTFGGAGLEAALTAKEISGWRSYVGQVSRPNDATYFITFNMPELSPDLAQRSVIINIGSPRHEAAFVEWASGFVRTHRAQLIADLVAVLKRPKTQIPAEGRDRWQAWMRDVLGCFPNAAALAALVKERRPSVDAEADDREDWTDMLSALCRRLRGTTDGELNAHEIYAEAITRKLWQPDKNTAESRDRQNCLRRAERMLAGTGVMERATTLTGEKKMARVRDNQGSQAGRSQVFNIKGVSDSGSNVDLDIPY